MRIPETKITLDKQCVREDADQGKQGIKAEKIQKGPDNSAAPGALDITELGEVDVVTISRGLKSVSGSIIPSEAGAPGKQDESRDSDTKSFITTLFKDRIIKGEKCPGATGITEALNILESEKTDVVTVSRGLKTFLKSILLSGTGEPRQIVMPQGTGVSPFLMTLLKEAFPGWRVRLLKVYRRKKGGSLGKRGKEGIDKRQEEPSGAKTGDNYGNFDPVNSRYKPERIKLKAAGLIRTNDMHDLRFDLELVITPESGIMLRGEDLRLNPLIINYHGSPDELGDLKFTFCTDQETGEEGAPFSGPGFGSLVIDLVEVGTAEDGSTVYGVSEGGAPHNGPWIEEKMDSPQNNRRK